jgi:hypothetical protein
MGMAFCPSLQRLRESRYVDRELVYLQRLAVTSSMDPELMFCRFCMKCGSRLTNHDDSNCLVPRNMMLLGRLQRTNGQHLFNLELVAIYRNRIQGDPDYPEPPRMYYCPYCGERYELDLAL